MNEAGREVGDASGGGLLPISAAVLAGGRSSRFGSNKALAPVGGEPLIACPVRLLQGLAEDVFVVANDPDAYSFLGVPVLADLRPGLGPLSGIHAALKHAKCLRVFVAACDMPRLAPALIRRLATVARSVDLVVPASRAGPEPLCAVYGRGLLPVIEAALDRGDGRLADLVDRARAHVVPWQEVLALAAGEDPFVNVNTPEDYRRILAGG